MKNTTEQELEEIIRYYGSLAAYNEEQRRCTLVTIETALQANPFTRRFRLENALPVKVVKTNPGKRPFWLKFRGQKA